MLSRFGFAALCSPTSQKAAPKTATASPKKTGTKAAPKTGAKKAAPKKATAKPKANSGKARKTSTAVCFAPILQSKCDLLISQAPAVVEKPTRMSTTKSGRVTKTTAPPTPKAASKQRTTKK